MTKANYLELIKEIGKAVRENNIRYGRIYSEKRNSSGYRTKFWYVFHGKTNDIAAIAKQLQSRQAATLLMLHVYVEMSLLLRWNFSETFLLKKGNPLQKKGYNIN